jgi:diguanylate cyclase (GGDEF)-like protein
MARKSKAEHLSNSTILLVDDNPEYLEATRLLLEREGHQVIPAANGLEALALLRKQSVDLMLLDYFMPGMTGEEVVLQLRQFNPFVQVILQTGYASERPPRELLRRLDIQGYYDKSEGPDKLLLWTEVGLKIAYSVQLLHKSRQGLRYILAVTPDLHKIQPLDDLLSGILWQLAGLLGAVNSFLAVLPKGESPAPASPDSFLAMVDEETELIIRAGTGRFAHLFKVDHFVEPERFALVRKALQRVDRYLDPEKISTVIRALQRSEVQVVENSTIVPLRVGEVTLGVIYLDRPVQHERDLELLHIFANQAAVAIHNVQLYEMATLDPLTGVQIRTFFEQWLLRELRSAFRSLRPLALLMLDTDGLKQINDTVGHLAGDQVLSILGRVLRQATRAGDSLGRYGGDEFAILLPQTNIEVAEQVGQRILNLLREKTIEGPDGPLTLTASIGLCLLEPQTFRPVDIPRPLPSEYFQVMAQALVRQADEALYQAKRTGRNKLFRVAPFDWLPFPSSSNGGSAGEKE